MDIGPRSDAFARRAALRRAARVGRGSEDCKVHSVKPMEQFVFEWNAPPTIPVIGGLRTLVYLDFKPLPDNRTELTLRNFGYGEGGDWAKSKACFAQAWPAVMASLEKRFPPK